MMTVAPLSFFYLSLDVLHGINFPSSHFLVSVAVIGLSLFLSLALLGMGFELWPLTFFSKASMSDKVTAPMGVSVGQCSITFVV